MASLRLRTMFRFVYHRINWRTVVQGAALPTSFGTVGFTATTLRARVVSVWDRATLLTRRCILNLRLDTKLELGHLLNLEFRWCGLAALALLYAKEIASMKLKLLRARAWFGWLWRIGLVKRTTAFRWEVDASLGETSKR